MPKVSVNILTKNRAELLKTALASVAGQTFRDVEVVVVNDGSTDDTLSVLNQFASSLNLQIINHPASLGITRSRQEALLSSHGDYLAILDDDDEWLDADKLKKQVEFLDANPSVVLVGGGISISTKYQESNTKQIPNKYQISKFRPESDNQIRRTMLMRNNFFTSTVMFRRQPAILAGGFIINGPDLAEDYDLWLRLGNLGQMYNFQETFAAYSIPNYNKDRFLAFLSKQLALIQREKANYPWFWLAKLILTLRMIYGR